MQQLQLKLISKLIAKGKNSVLSFINPRCGPTDQSIMSMSHPSGYHYQAPDVECQHYADDDEAILRLYRNDPEIAGLTVGLVDTEYSGNDNEEWMENVGDAVQESTHLRMLTIVDDSDGRARPKIDRLSN